MSTTFEPRTRRPLALGVAFALMVVGFVALPGVAAAAPVSVPAAEDSYVGASTPTSVFGTRAYMVVDGDPEQVAYLKFDIPAGTDLSSGVRLRIFSESSHRTGVVAHAVADSTWTEGSLTYATRPAVGAAAGSSGGLTAATWKEFDVAPAVTATGTVSIALVATSTTAAKITSSEGANPPALIIGAVEPPPPPSTEFTISPVSGGPYQAVSATATYTGTLKAVGEQAVADLKVAGGGTVNFTAGRFDFGAEYFKFYDLVDIAFVGAGMGATEIVNNSSSAADTEPFNFTGTTRVTIRDLTIIAGGAARTTSDAIDFDRGNNSLVENVAITGSRARGIVFDGKDATANANGNTVRGCVISGIPGTGIELLAASNNTITGCSITGVGNYGIHVKAASPTSDQPNKKSSGNTLSGNTIDESGRDGIFVDNSDRNTITGNTVTNSSDNVSGRDGIRIGTSGTAGLTCDDNVVTSNTATDNQATKTQSYGLNIASSLCSRTVVGPGNNFAGNRVGPFKNLGTATDIRQTF